MRLMTKFGQGIASDITLVVSKEDKINPNSSHKNGLIGLETKLIVNKDGVNSEVGSLVI